MLIKPNGSLNASGNFVLQDVDAIAALVEVVMHQIRRNHCFIKLTDLKWNQLPYQMIPTMNIRSFKGEEIMKETEPAVPVGKVKTTL